MIQSLARLGLRKNRSIRPAVFLAVLVLAACSTSASRTELSATPVSAAQKSATLAQKTVPSPAATPTTAAPRSPLGSAASRALRPCLARPAQFGVGCGPCPPVLAAPLPLLRCPAPPNPPVPPTGAARISFCAGLPITLKTGPVPFMQLAVCGTGFASYEVVTITLTSTRGTTSWSTIAGARGTFDSALPSSICGLAPAQLVARGNKGHVSNTLSLSPIFCRPRM
jgi:hypothetical protein